MTEFFSILTWNIWFDQRHFNDRINHIVKILKDFSPNVICLQEVIIESLNLILNDKKLSSLYDFYYDTSLITIPGKYGEITMVKKGYVCQFISVPFKNSKMGRHINALNIEELNLDVINVHLESVFRKYFKPKQEQFNFLADNVILPNRNIIMCGDMNMDEYDDENWATNKIQECGLIDVGTKSSAACPPTYDCDKNVNAYNYKSRLDRMLCKGTDLQVKSYKLVGTTIIPEIGIHPSDHFGILCNFDISK